MPHPIISSKRLPSPRIELRWNKAGTMCDYDIVIPLRDIDIRAEGKDGKLGVKKELRINVGQTQSNPGGTHIFGDRIMGPFRDGAHAMWDAKHLGNPPIYVVEGNKAQLQGD